MRRRFEQFMYGRYGTDELSKFMLGVCIVCLIVNFFTRSSLAYFVEITLLFLCYLRMFSKNYARRSAENAKYLEITRSIRSGGIARTLNNRIQKTKHRIIQSKDFHIYKCPTCGQKIRIPRGKGRICITCPKCRCEFEKKS